MSEAERREAVLLVDIEGGEFGLMDAAIFTALRDSAILIELHTGMVAQGEARLAQLLTDAAATHDVRELKTGARDLSGYAELADWTDTDRWLICSEGRPSLMSWLLLSPKGQSPAIV